MSSTVILEFVVFNYVDIGRFACGIIFLLLLLEVLESLTEGIQEREVFILCVCYDIIYDNIHSKLIHDCVLDNLSFF